MDIIKKVEHIFVDPKLINNQINPDIQGI